MQSSNIELSSTRSPSGGLFSRIRQFDWSGAALKALRICLFYLALLAFWQIIYDLEVWKPYILPSPSDVWEALKRQADNGVLQEAAQRTMARLFIGYAVSLVFGLTLGMLCGANKYLDETVGSLVLGLQSLPSVTWVPLAILWFGLNDNAIYFVVFMGSVCAVAISARSGIQSIPPLYKRASLTMGANRYQTLRYMLIPAMVPSMAQGLKLGWSFAWRSLMAAELLLAGKPSLGGLLEVGRNLNDMSLVIAMMLVIVAIGLAVDRLVFARIEWWVQDRWGLQA